jgi:hypothetical protein
LIGIELEDVPEEQHQEHHQQDEHDDRQACEDKGFAGSDGIEDTDVECLQRAQQGQKEKYSESEKKDGTLTRIAEELHGEIIEAGNRE